MGTSVGPWTTMLTAPVMTAIYRDYIRWWSRTTGLSLYVLTCVSVSSYLHTFLNNATVYLIVPIPFKIAATYVRDKVQDVREFCREILV